MAAGVNAARHLVPSTTRTCGPRQRRLTWVALALALGLFSSCMQPCQGRATAEVIGAMEQLRDVRTAERVANRYVGRDDLGRLRWGRISAEARATIDKAEKLLREAEVDVVPILVRALRTVGLDPFTGEDSSPYSAMNLGTGATRGGWPNRVLDIIEERAEPRHAADFASLLDVQDLAIVRWAAERIVTLADDDFRSDVSSQIEQTLSGEGKRYARIGAIHAYMRLQPGDSRPVLAAVSDPDWLIRSHAIRVLGEYRVEQARTAIARAKQDSDVDVRIEAERALHNLDGREVPFPASRTYLPGAR